MTGIWPGETRIGVMLTFDLDGPSGALNRDPSLADKPSLLSLGEFGPNVGLPRILSLLDEEAIAASFYVPGWVAERWPDEVKRIADAGHEIGHHGYLHEPPGTLESREEEAEITFDFGEVEIYMKAYKPDETEDSSEWLLPLPTGWPVDISKATWRS